MRVFPVSAFARCFVLSVSSTVLCASTAAGV
jgi:hypothetical protein